MHQRVLCFAVVLLFLNFSVIRGQNHSCIETYEGFDAIAFEIRPDDSDNIHEYIRTMTWYTDSRCIVIGSTSGLWLYDIDHPTYPLMLASHSDRTIDNIAINPVDSRIAFSVTQEPTVYIINTDQTTSTFTADSPAVTSIAFSPDGMLMAIASSKVGEFEEGVYGFYHEPKVQIRNTLAQTQLALLTPDTGFVESMFFTSDNRHLLTSGIRPGYIGNDVEYWDITSTSPIWNYSDLLCGLEQWSFNDPLAVEMVSMRGETLALGGLDGYHDYDEYYGNGIHIWDAERQQRISEIVVNRPDYKDDENWLADIAFNSDGSTLVSGNTNGVLRLWQIPDGSQIAEFNIEITHVQQIDFSPNDQFLAILSENEVVIWDVERMEEYTSFDLPNDALYVDG